MRIRDYVEHVQARIISSTIKTHILQMFHDELNKLQLKLIVAYDEDFKECKDRHDKILMELRDINNLTIDEFMQRDLQYYYTVAYGDKAERYSSDNQLADKIRHTLNYNNKTL